MGSVKETETSSDERAKRAAAEAAVALVKDGMTLGLGSGSTVAFALTALAERIRREQLHITGVPTSARTEESARALQIPLTDLPALQPLDLAIDGADEVESKRLFLIKGRGGALLREKIIAFAARLFVVIVDEGKIVTALGARAPLPVEVARFAHERTAQHLVACLGPAMLRRAGGAPLVTDNGNFIYDVAPRAPITEPEALERELQAIPGVLANGLFTRAVAHVFVGAASGTVRTLDPTPA